MKIYKHYFKKTDTPYIQEFQKRNKYHTAWKHFAYTSFVGHKVYKIKLFGIFTIYKDKGKNKKKRKIAKKSKRINRGNKQ